MGFFSMTHREAEALLLRGVMLSEEERIAWKMLRGESISREEEQHLGYNSSSDSSDGEDLLPASETRRKQFAPPVSVVHFDCYDFNQLILVFVIL